MLRCCPSPDGNDYTLCGLAYEELSNEYGDPEHTEPGDIEERELAARGKRITCPRCVALIAFCKTITGNISPGE